MVYLSIYSIVIMCVALSFYLVNIWLSGTGVGKFTLILAGAGYLIFGTVRSRKQCRIPLRCNNSNLDIFSVQLCGCRCFVLHHYLVVIRHIDFPSFVPFHFRWLRKERCLWVELGSK